MPSMLMHMASLLFPFLLTCILLHGSSGAGTDTDNAALLSFLSSLSPPSLPDWGSSTNACAWSGVSCRRRSLRVALLDLSGRGLRGYISPSLSGLSSLEVIDLSNNFLSGPIPPQLGSLPRLKQLSLSSNILSGPIPPQLSLLARLVYLDLGGNCLAGSIPPALFCRLSTLQYIDLSNNSLSGSIPLPSALPCGLPDLRFLLLWSNRLTGPIPPSLSNSSHLEWIDLEDNRLSGGLPPLLFGRMPSLQFLYLSYNDLSAADLHPFFLSLSNCSQLQELELAQNKIGGPLPPSVAALPSALVELHLEDNRISGPIHPAISNLLNLTYLNLSNNVLNGSIPPEIARLCRLERLHLSANHLSGEIPLSFGRIPHLGLLDVSRNRLSGPIPDSFSRLSQLRQLLLHGNRLSGRIPPSLANCLNLEALDLSFNRLTGTIPPQVAAGLQNLKLYLNLSANSLRGRLPLEIGKMDMILALDLSRNSLSGAIPSQLASCVALERLNLSFNSFSGALPGSVAALPYLKSLDLSSNKLAGCLPDTLRKSSSLRELNLSFNNFSGAVPSGGVFDSLTAMDFTGNLGLCGHRIEGIRRCGTGEDRRHIQILASVIGILGMILMSLSIGLPLMRKKSRLPSFRRPVLQDMDSFHECTFFSHGDYPRVSYRQLLEATDGFADTNLIGSGRFGRVYKGSLASTGENVAVKTLNGGPAPSSDAGLASESFRRECEVLKRTKHRNLIRIVTACSRPPDFKALVLPLMPNGSLELWLRPPKRAHLSLELMVRVAGDVAEGMAYLHHYSPVRVVHCDLKPSNVLLDGDMTALVADFGIARLVAINKDGDGTPIHGLTASGCISTADLLHGSVGYIAPEYGVGGHPSTQGDVYSFGVLLLEIITGKHPTDIIFQEGLTMHEWVKSLYPSSIESVVHQEPALNLPSLAQRDPSYYKKLKRDVISEMIELGLSCTQYSPSMRPTMIDVAHDFAILKQSISRLAADKNKR